MTNKLELFKGLDGKWCIHQVCEKSGTKVWSGLSILQAQQILDKYLVD